MEPHVVTDLNLAVVATRLGNQHLDSRGLVGKRLLDENVGLSLESGERLFNVVNRWSADQDDVRLEVPERLRIIGKTFTLEFVAAILQRCGTGVAKTELLQSQRLEVLCVTPADGTAADHQASISNPLGSS